MRIIESVQDVDAQVLAHVEEVWDGWWADEPRIDWQDFIDRVASYGIADQPPYDFESYWSPAVRKIQRHVRALKLQ